MLIRNDLPKLGTNLVTALKNAKTRVHQLIKVNAKMVDASYLASLQVNNLAHPIKSSTISQAGKKRKRKKKVASTRRVLHRNARRDNGRGNGSSNGKDKTHVDFES